jgi:hypothetical protein
VTPRRCAIALAMFVVCLARPAAAQVTSADLQIAARAIGFIQNLHSSPLDVEIVYDPKNPQSQQQAQQLAGLFGDGLHVGNLLLRPVVTPLDRIGSSNADLYFLTAGMGNAAQRVGQASRQRQVPCITFDLAQVRAGTCTMGVQARPRISVIVNRAAAEASHTEFSAVFRIMITEI